MTETTYHYGSVVELLAAASAPAPSYCTNQSSRDGERGDWYGSESYKEAETLALRWDEGAEKIARVRVAAAAGARPRVVYRRSVTGPGTVSIPDVIVGLPDPYRRRTHVPRTTAGRGKIVRILVNNAASSGVSSDAYLSRGGAILALCDALERSGRRVEITVAVGISGVSAGKKADREVYVTVKRAGDRANLATIAFAIAHPSFLRRIGFSLFERMDREFVTKHVNSGGYGYPGSVASEGYDIALGEMSYGDSNFATEAAAKAWVTTKCQEFGIRISE